MPIYRVSVLPERSGQISKQMTERYTKHSQQITFEPSRPDQQQVTQNKPADDERTAPIQSGATSHLVLHKSTSSSKLPKNGDKRPFDCDSFIVKEFEEQHRREEELRRQRSLLAPPAKGSNDVGSAEQKLKVSHGKVVEDLAIRLQEVGSSPDESSMKPMVRVPPYEDPDDDSSNSFIRPHQETVIEREVKLTRQRESSLRRVRGYPVLRSRDKPVEVELSGFDHDIVRSRSPGGHQILSPSNGDSSVSDGSNEEDVSMKRLATNRLRLEILRERQREVDLRSQGKIYTISEERIGQPLVLTDLKREGKVQRKELLTGDIQRPLNILVGGDIQKKQVRDNIIGTNDNGVDGRQVHGLQSALKAAAGEKQKRTAGEKLIEEEVKELRRREEELREQRKFLLPVVDDRPLTNQQRSTYVRT